MPIIIKWRKILYVIFLFVYIYHSSHNSMLLFQDKLCVDYHVWEEIPISFKKEKKKGSFTTRVVLVYTRWGHEPICLFSFLERRKHEYTGVPEAFEVYSSVKTVGVEGRRGAEDHSWVGVSPSSRLRPRGKPNTYQKVSFTGTPTPVQGDENKKCCRKEIEIPQTPTGINGYFDQSRDYKSRVTAVKTESCRGDPYSFDIKLDIQLFYIPHTHTHTTHTIQITCLFILQL